MNLSKVKIKIEINGGGARSIYDLQSDAPNAKVPATPLETLVTAAKYLAHVAEAHGGHGHRLIAAVNQGIRDIQGVRDGN